MDGYKSAAKKRKKCRPQAVFLLGGNSHDPLNLQSIETNRLSNQITPNSSPYPKSFHKADKVQVLIPPDIRDPLNLSGPGSLHESDLVSPDILSNKKNKRKRTSSETQLDVSVSNFKEDEHKNSYSNEIVSPVVNPRFVRTQNHKGSNSLNNLNLNAAKKVTDFKQTKNEQIKTVSSSKACNYKYGNYNRYYGYRKICDVDPRLVLFSKALFKGKDVLDIGCNIGHITLTIARDFEPKKIVGIDIDDSLIQTAIKNIPRYVTEKVVKDESFPISMPLLFGPLSSFPDQFKQLGSSQVFPRNTFFVTVNYVPESDECLHFQQAEYDCILCLSITKWIHLNWGDTGIKRMFHRVYLHLRPGGTFILEPQSWNSYLKKSKLLVSFSRLFFSRTNSFFSLK